MFSQVSGERMSGAVQEPPAVWARGGFTPRLRHATRERESRGFAPPVIMLRSFLSG